MNSMMMRFAEQYSLEFIERLNTGRFDGTLTEDEIKRARDLSCTADCMANDTLLSMKDLMTTMHVAATDEETGFFDKEEIQGLTLYAAEKLEEVHKLRQMIEEIDSAVRQYELDKLKAGVSDA